MALTATLKFGDNEKGNYDSTYNVVDCSYQFSRPYNEFHPKGEARCNQVELTVVAPGKNDLKLIEWFAKEELKSGCLTIELPIYGNASSSDKHILKFENAKCFRLIEEYDIDAPRCRLLRLSMIAEQMNIDDVIF